jgi:hypothetical protein
VAKVRLYFIESDRHDFLDANGATIDLIYLRLTAMLRIGASGYVCDGLIDTGSALSVFPESIWRIRGGNRMALPKAWPVSQAVVAHRERIDRRRIPVPHWPNWRHDFRSATQ